MKNLLLLLMVFCFVACSENIEEPEQAVTSTEAVHSLSDFQDLVDENIYPLNLVDENTIQAFKSSLKFEDGRLKTFNYESLAKYLSDSELEDLFGLMAGGSLELVKNKNEGVLESRVLIGLCDANDPCCPIYFFKRAPTVCSGTIPADCCSNVTSFCICIAYPCECTPGGCID